MTIEERVALVLEDHALCYTSVHDEVWRTNPVCIECGQAFPCSTVRHLKGIPNA